MTIDSAMQSPVDSLTGKEIWTAMCAIGAHKLAMRNGRKSWDRMGDELRPYNVRLDVLQAEDERRRLLNRKPKVQTLASNPAL